MNLLQMSVNEPLVVDGINSSDKVLKERMRSLGIVPDSSILIKRFGLFKSTVMVAIGGTWVGLRKTEAQIIDVHSF